MAGYKNYVIGFLTIILATSAYFIITLNGSGLQINIDKTKSTFSINQSGELIIAGVEQNYLYNGSKSVLKTYTYAINNKVDGNDIMVTRTINYSHTTLTDYYSFDASKSDVESFPISHKICVLNGQGLTLMYQVSKLSYVGVSRNAISPESFGYKMKIEFQEGYTSAKISKLLSGGRLQVKYKINTDNECFNVRLFDPTYIVEDNKVYVNDSKIYLSAEPHTYNQPSCTPDVMDDACYIYPSLMAKNFTGAITVIFGYPNGAKPSSFEVNKPFKLNITDINGTHEESFNNWTNINVPTNNLVNWNYEGMNQWRYVPGLNIQANKMYDARIRMGLNNETSFKYWFCVMPSVYGSNVQNAQANGHLYCLDPWVNMTTAISILASGDQNYFGDAGSGYDMVLAQSFTYLNSTGLQPYNVTIRLNKGAGEPPAGYLTACWMEIYTNASGRPGTMVARSDSLIPCNSSSSSADLTMNFTNYTSALTQNNVYFALLNYTPNAGSVTPQQFSRWVMNGVSIYPKNSFQYHSNDGSFTNFGVYDFYMVLNVGDNQSSSGTPIVESVNISLMGPADNTLSNNLTQAFRYNFTTNKPSNPTNCTLWMNGTFNAGTNYTCAQNTILSLTNNATLAYNTTYLWFINITTNESSYKSLIYNYTTNVSPPMVAPEINVSLGNGVLFNFTPDIYNFYQQNVVPQGQTDNVGLFYVCNNGSVSTNVSMNVESVSSGATLTCDDTNNSSLAINITTNNQTIISNLNVSLCTYIWCWADYAGLTSEFNFLTNVVTG